MEKKLVTPQKALIKQDGKILIIKRAENDNVFPGYWDFPGGKLEPGEDPIRGVEREVLEETGLRIRAIEAIWEKEMDIDAIYRGKFVVYTAELISGDIILSPDHTEFKWATKEEILQLKVEPFIIEFFREITS